VKTEYYLRIGERWEKTGYVSTGACFGSGRRRRKEMMQDLKIVDAFTEKKKRQGYKRKAFRSVYREWGRCSNIDSLQDSVSREGEWV